MTRSRLPGTALDALLGQPFGSAPWDDALERLEGPHPLGGTADLHSVLALPVMLRLQPEFERRQLKLLTWPVQDQGEAALYVTLGQARGPRHLIGSTGRTPEGAALHVFGYPLSQALGAAAPEVPIAALFAPAPVPETLSVRIDVPVDHPGGLLQAACEHLQLTHPHLLPGSVQFEVAGHSGRSLTLDVSAQVGHGPEGLVWAQPNAAPSPALPGSP